MQLRATIPTAKSHEEFFLGHYDWLLKWALQLSHGQHEQATDLVHDLYVQLVRSRPNIDFEDEDRARGYLYTMLRHLSVSKARREGRDALSSLLIVDYGSVEYGLRCVDRSKLILIRSDLARVCEYACIRRHTSRSASVLILRFFFGYYPSEIVRVLQTTPMAVEKHLQVARQEARVYLERPGTLRFLGQDVTPQSFSPHLPDEPTALFAELRARIFADPPLTCLPKRAIEARYAENSPPMEVAEFAHVVSCEHCLELSNAVLGLPSLADRFPPDTVGRDGGGAGAAGNRPNSEKLNKRVRQAHEHRPKKLQIAVDGEILAAQRISSARSELQMKLKPLAKPAFIEVFSEQGLRLAYLQIDESMMIDLQPIATSVELSDGRHLEVKLTFPNGNPVVKLSYYDPVLDTLVTGVTPPVSPADKPSDMSSKSTLAGIKVFVENALRPWFPSFASPWPLILAAGAALLALVCSFPYLYTRTSSEVPMRPTASALLTQSREFERSSTGRGGAIHSRFSLETVTDDGTVAETQTIDSWRSTAPHRSAIRLLDSHGKLVAGVWKDTKGKLTEYPAKPARSLSRTDALGVPEDLDTIWQSIGQGVSSNWLTKVEGQLRVVQQSDGFNLRYDGGAALLLKADLLLLRGSSELVRGAFTIRKGTDRHEYRFRNITFEVVPANQVRDQDFLPDVDPRSTRAALISNPLDLDNAHAMLVALHRVDQLGPAIGAVLDVTRGSSNRIEVDGILPNRERLAFVTKALRPLGRSGQLKLVLHSREERSSVGHATSNLVATSAPLTLENAKVPLDSELRSALSTAELSESDLEQAIQRSAQDGISHGNVAYRAAYKLEALAAVDFSPNELRRITSEDKIIWLRLMSEQSKVVDDELAEVRKALYPILPRGDSLPFPDAGSSQSVLDSPEELGKAARQLSRDCKRLYQLLIDDLAISPSDSPRPADSTELKQQLCATQELESRVSRTLVVLSQ